MSARTESRRKMLLANMTIPTVPAETLVKHRGHDRDRHFARAGRTCP